MFDDQNPVADLFHDDEAIGMLQEGMIQKGLTCIADIRNRYEGRKHNLLGQVSTTNCKGSD